MSTHFPPGFELVKLEIPKVTAVQTQYGRVRWYNGVLEQEVTRTEYSGSAPVRVESNWEPVPTETGP